MYKNIILPASILAETIIGAGMFALPFVFLKAGLTTGIFYLIFFGLVFILLNLMYADIILRTPENHRFVGYAKTYLGSLGFWSGMLMTIFGTVFALTAYLVLSISFVDLIWPTASDIYKILIFWFVSSAAIFWDVNKVAMSEFFILLGTALIILVIFGFGLSNFNYASVTNLNFSYLFFPYGVVLFSLAGRSAIPTVLGYFRKNNEQPVRAKWPIIIGGLIPVFVYIIFVLGVLGFSSNVSEDSVSGLVGSLPFFVLAMLGILGIITMWSTYIVIGRDVKKSLEHDLGLHQKIAGLATIIPPLLFYFLGFNNFLELISIVGSVFIGIEGIFVVLIWRKASKIESPEGHKIFDKINPLLIYLLILVFIGGVLYKLIY
ncbi:hypothetical protein A2999_00025 [Candidatus Wolfebacteria bacterium RIFCSPLOWO2_01_FULL_38_11]|uniref:Aromatic amino acid permease n=2 Tax=Candidatus Wolfeibacteriota TaxID=1752735 RepID=A0A0G0IGQ7_9BACT|nr:MAG: hypothetical protein US36_C0001G0003 [Candidatus Wolfebacteria bacterium GW2011_GWC1_37_10]OGM90342.1 MAG: hypothetical protein A2999_00025 [Candidatus Wolfebacteria bacterium RIFCSPLOWO2_01_FULL_38_11]